jgi:hypothetical protein
VLSFDSAQIETIESVKRTYSNKLIPNLEVGARFVRVEVFCPSGRARTSKRNFGIKRKELCFLCEREIFVLFTAVSFQRLSIVESAGIENRFRFDLCLFLCG